MCICVCPSIYLPKEIENSVEELENGVEKISQKARGKDEKMRNAVGEGKRKMG